MVAWSLGCEDRGIDIHWVAMRCGREALDRETHSYAARITDDAATADPICFGYRPVLSRARSSCDARCLRSLVTRRRRCLRPSDLRAAEARHHAARRGVACRSGGIVQALVCARGKRVG